MQTTTKGKAGEARVGRAAVECRSCGSRQAADALTCTACGHQPRAGAGECHCDECMRERPGRPDLLAFRVCLALRQAVRAFEALEAEHAGCSCQLCIDAQAIQWHLETYSSIIECAQYPSITYAAEALVADRDDAADMAHLAYHFGPGADAEHRRMLRAHMALVAAEADEPTEVELTARER